MHCIGHTPARWFVGANDKNRMLYDESTGGCRDGLTADGVNENQGAESAIACIAAFQQGNRIELILSDRHQQGTQQVGLMDGGRANRAVGRTVG